MQIADDVHLIDGSRASNIYLVTGAEPMLVDTGMPRSARLVLHYLESMGLSARELRLIVLTHHDIDHIGSAADLHAATGAPIWAPRGDLAYIRGDLPRHGFKRYLPTLLRPVLGPLKSFPVQRELAEGDLLPGGFTVLETPGHTPGHLSLHRPGLLIAGDLLSTQASPSSRPPTVVPSPPGMSSDPAQVRASVRRVASLDCDAILAGHGAPIQSGGNRALASLGL